MCGCRQQRLRFSHQLLCCYLPAPAGRDTPATCREGGGGGGGKVSVCVCEREREKEEVGAHQGASAVSKDCLTLTLELVVPASIKKKKTMLLAL